VVKLWKGIVVGLVVLAFVGGLGLGLAQEKVKLVIAGRDGVYGQALELASNLYMEENPDVDITLLKLPYASLYEKLVIALREKTGAYDVVMLDDVWATEFMSQGWLKDLEAMGFVADPDFVGKALAVGRYPYPDGRLYGVPFVGNVELFAYRKDLFAKYDLPRPETWLDVLEAAITIDLKEPEVKGIVFRGVKGNPIVTGFLPIFWAFGAEIIDEAGEPQVDSPQAIAALKFFLKLKRYAPEGVETYNASEVRDALQQGEVAIAIEVWPAWVPALDDPEVSKVVGKVEIIPAPGLITAPAPLIGIWLLGIAADAKQPGVALDFLKFISSAEIQKRLALEVGLPPTRTSIYRDEEVIAKYRWYPAQLEALEASKPRPRITQWAQVEAILGDYLQLALIGALSPEEALREANAKIAEALGG